MKIKVLLTLIALWLCMGAGKVCADDIVITTKGQLKEVRDAVNNGTSYYGITINSSTTIYLKADIKLGNETWTPIGTEAHPFCGHFEGWGHKITNLSVNTGSYAGLFGYINGGSVRDVGVEGTTIQGTQYVGGICGCLINGGEINSCYSKIAVSGVANIGGICGSSAGKIENCWHQGDITGSATSEVKAGGLVGYSNGTLERCYVINTKIRVKNIGKWDPYNENEEMNSFFGKIAGLWTKTNNLKMCVYNTNDVSVLEFFDNPETPEAEFLYGSDVVVGSLSGSASSDLDTTVKGADDAKMKKADFWNGELEAPDNIPLLNTDYDKIYSSNNNVIWLILNDSYPKLYSFEKALPIEFDFTNKQWYTIVPNGNYRLPEGVEAYIVTSATAPTTTDVGVANLHKVTTLNEGCGALVYRASETVESITIAPLTYPLTEELDDYTGNLLKGSPTYPELVGNPNNDDFEASSDYILKDGTFGRASYGTIARGKAYLHAPFPATSASSSLRFVFEDESTGIDAIEEKSESDAVWYTLDGRKLESVPSERGVYIVNGKKVLIQ